MHRRFAAILIAAAALPAAAQELPRAHAPQPTAASVTPADAMTRLYILADDSMLGRQAGHLGNVKGTNYIAAEFRRIGLEPAGTDGYFQQIPLVSKGLAPGRALSVGGTPVDPADFAPLPFLANVFPYGATAAVNGAQAVFGGRLGGNLISAEQARGRVVVLLAPMGTDGRPTAQFWRGRPANPFPGAAAVAIASLDITPAGIRDFIGSESTELDDGSTPPEAAPGFLVSTAAATRMLGADPASLAPGAAGGAVTLSYQFRRGQPEAPARNVVGLLRGSDPAVNGQYVVISAHNDHEGILERALDHDSVRAFNRVIRPQGANDPAETPTPEQAARIRVVLDSLRALHGGAVRRDSIMNGADDDGSGTVALLEIAESLAAGQRPRRSVLFVSHTAEEMGLYGSEHFTDHPTVPRDSIVAALNMDMVGRGRAEDIAGGGTDYIQMIGSRRLSTQLGAAIDSLNAGRSEPMRIDYSFDAAGHPLNRYCRSDHFMYARYGIPITYFSRGYHVDYHQVGDEPQYIDYAGLARVAGFVRDVALAVANRPERLVVDGPRQDPSAPCRQ